MKSLLKKIGVASTVWIFVLGLAYAPASPALAPKPVSAQWFVFDGSNFLQNTWTAISTGFSAVVDEFELWKEGLGDGIGYLLINAIIEQLIRDTTAWVASGFQGKPAFVEDLGGFLGDLADTLVGDFIWNSDTLGFLCSPFAFNVKFALDLQYQNSRDYQRNSGQCTLSGTVDNIGNFMEKNWDNWFAVTMDSNNNPYGAYSRAQAGLAATVSSARRTESTKLSFGSGFFSKEECTDEPLAEGEMGPPRQTCKTVTPGETIQNSIANSLNIPNSRLAFADEINELIGALLTQLARGVLSEVGGLTGLGQSAAGSSGGIFNDPRYQSGIATGTNSAINQQVTSDLQREEQYRSLSQRIIDEIDPTLSRTQQSCEPATRTRLDARADEALAGVNAAIRNINRINAYRSELASLTNPTAIQSLVQQYMYEIRPTLHTNQQLAGLETALTSPPSNDTDLLTTMAEQGSVIALVRLYARACGG